MWEYSTSIDIASLLSSDSPVIIFKHSNRCSISDIAFRRIKDARQELNSSAKFTLIDVVANRSISLQIAEELDVPHESPQVIVLKNGKVVHTASHMNIRPSVILSHL
ncbi:MAG: thioredoxin family protein [Bacteroidetes bacterium]|nr:MAG: thioredoxin family protein [Bacteroidota bacterium]